MSMLPPFVQTTFPYNFEAEVLGRLDLIIANQQAAATKEDQIMATLQQDVDAVAAETTAIASVTTMINALEAQVAALPGLTAEQQTQIDTIFDGMTKNAASLAAALVINVPPAPPPTFVPPIVVVA